MYYTGTTGTKTAAAIPNGSVTLEYHPFVDTTDAVAEKIVLSASVFSKNIFHVGF